MGGQGMRQFIDLFETQSNITESAPPMYDPEDEDHYDALHKTGFFGAQGAGCVLMAKSTGRLLLVKRSSAVEQPGDWSSVGGAFKEPETPIVAARREANEETGYSGRIQMVPLLVFRKGTFRYSNFLGLIEDEFVPDLGWEAVAYEWCEVGHWPQPLHFGMQSLFGDAASMNTIMHYVKLFTQD